MGKLQQAHDDLMAARRAHSTAAGALKRWPSPASRAHYARALQHAADCHTTYTEQLDQRHDRLRYWWAIVLLCTGTAAGHLTAHYFLFN